MKYQYLLISTILVIVLFLTGCIHSTEGVKEQGFYKGKFLYAEIEDGCGDVIWCSTDIHLEGAKNCSHDRWYHFGEPCHFVMGLDKNVTYVFRYEPFENMDCSGDYFWDIRLSEICDEHNNSLWKYSGFEG